MPDFEITSPDGKKFVVTAPDGASQDQVLAYAQSQFKAPAASTEATTPRIAQEAAYKGVAGLADSVLNTPNNLLNLGKAAVGTVAGAAGRPDLMPDLTPNPDFARRGLQATGLIDPNIQPQGFVQKGVDALTQGAVGGALTGGASVPRALVGASMGALSSGAATATEAAGGSPALAATAGMLAPALAAKVPGAIAASAPGLMQSALKPTLADQRSGKGERAINTLLKEGVNPTQGGVDKLNVMLDGLENQLTGVLQRYSGKTVDKGEVASRLQDVVSKIERVNPTPQDALRDVNKVYDDFLTNGLVPKNIPIEQANELKRGLYQMLKQKYGIPVADETINARKALARGFKETIEGQAPEVSPINARMGDLANARNVAERRAMVEGNKNPAGLALIANDPMAALGFLADRSALAKSLLARGAYQFNGLAGIAPNVAAQTSPIVTAGTLAELYRQQHQGQ